jgi:hypothetical protein
MVDETARTKTSSLGELISALRPGDICLWCGGRLRCGTALRKVGGGSGGDPADAREPDANDVALCCPDCGSEICTAGTASRAHGRTALSTAA